MPTYGDRYGSGPAFRPGSMALALGLTVGPIAALVMGLQINQIIKDPKVLTTYPVPPDQPPPPPDPKPQPKTKALPTETVYTPPIQPVLVPPINPIPTTDILPPPNIAPVIGKVPDPGPIQPVVVAKPVIVDAFVESRYQGLLQPPYPPEEQRAGNSGRVVLRVLIGTDGRVKQVEKVSAASDAFFASAQRQAMGKWRFKPATRDGVPIEQWKVMSLRFVLNEQ
jgi:protein TonB